MSSFPVILSVICNFISVEPGKYILVPIQMNWFNASLYCEDMGTSLASIHSESDHDEAISLCNSTCKLLTGCSSCWSGLNDIEFEGIWEWDDGSITDYGYVNNSDEHPTYGEYPWAHRNKRFGPEPNNNDGIENCVQLWEAQDFKWNDQNCLDMCNPICHQPQTVNPINIPTSEPTYIPSNVPTTNPTEIPSKPPSLSPVRTVLSIGRVNIPTMSPIQMDQKVDATVFESEDSQTGSTGISDDEEIEDSTKASLAIILITMGSVSVLLISVGFIIRRFQRSKVPRMLNVVSNDIRQFNNNKKDAQSAKAEPQRKQTMGEV